MINIPFLDESYVQWQILSCNKIADKNISVVKAALNYDINPHMLYSGEYVARRISHTGYVSYGHYINKCYI